MPMPIYHDHEFTSTLAIEIIVKRTYTSNYPFELRRQGLALSLVPALPLPVCGLALARAVVRAEAVAAPIQGATVRFD